MPDNISMRLSPLLYIAVLGSFNSCSSEALQRMKNNGFTDAERDAVIAEKRRIRDEQESALYEKQRSAMAFGTPYEDFVNAFGAPEAVEASEAETVAHYRTDDRKPMLYIFRNGKLAEYRLDANQQTIDATKRTTQTECWREFGGNVVCKSKTR